MANNKVMMDKIIPQIKEIINNVYKKLKSNAVFIGVGERSREGQELIEEMQESDLLDKMSMVFDKWVKIHVQDLRQYIVD